jgi:hypothetical protein
LDPGHIKIKAIVLVRLQNCRKYRDSNYYTEQFTISSLSKDNSLCHHNPGLHPAGDTHLTAAGLFTGSEFVKLLCDVTKRFPVYMSLKRETICGNTTNFTKLVDDKLYVRV